MFRGIVFFTRYASVLYRSTSSFYALYPTNEIIVGFSRAKTTIEHKYAGQNSKQGKGAASKLHLGNKSLKEVTKEDWKKVLTPEEYHVTRECGTEKAFSGKYDKFFEPGTYSCTCCGAELFLSDAKYNSGCGWPAFSKSVDEDLNIVRLKDNSFGMERTEVRCKQCNAHLGHVFDDGPKEAGGERYCINSVSINFSKNNSKS